MIVLAPSVLEKKYQVRKVKRDINGNPVFKIFEEIDLYQGTAYEKIIHIDITQLFTGGKKTIKTCALSEGVYTGSELYKILNS